MLRKQMAHVENAGGSLALLPMQLSQLLLLLRLSVDSGWHRNATRAFRRAALKRHLALLFFVAFLLAFFPCGRAAHFGVFKFK